MIGMGVEVVGLGYVWGKGDYDLRLEALAHVAEEEFAGARHVGGADESAAAKGFLCHGGRTGGCVERSVLALPGLHSPCFDQRLQKLEKLWIFCYQVVSKNRLLHFRNQHSGNMLFHNSFHSLYIGFFLLRSAAAETRETLDLLL